MQSDEIIPINQELTKLVNTYEMPEPLGFGQHLAPLMGKCLYQNGEWQAPEISAYQEFSIAPASKVFHYGQQIFEGMKAYRQGDKPPVLFRPEENCQRLQKSAIRMAMPPLPDEIFFQCLESLVAHLAPIIPRGENESLYLRPMMISFDNGLSLKAAEKYLFFLLASPSGSYFDTSRVAALIEREYCRAALGGTGAVKVAGNYGASIQSGILAKSLGYQQNLWLDAIHKKYIEEFSGMNFFAVVNNKLITPELTSTILPGVTRDTIIKIAKLKGLAVDEVRIDIDQLLQEIQNGSCSEIFACGTAAVLTPIAELGEKDGKRYQVAEAFGPIAKMLRQELTSIQTGRQPIDYDWVKPVKLTGNTND